MAGIGEKITNNAVLELDRKVVILLSRARSGSTFLRSCLNRHPDIAALSELFYPKISSDFILGFFRYAHSRILEDKSLLLFEFDHDRLLREFFTSVAISQDLRRIVLVDVKYSHADATPHFWLYLKNNKVPIIHLKRRDVLRAHVSEMITFERLRSNLAMHSFSLLPPLSIEIQTDGLLADLRQRRYEHTYYRDRIGHDNILEIEYEALVPRSGIDSCLSSEIAEKLSNFLGVEQIHYSSKLVKQTNSDLSGVIRNYKEVKKTLEGSEFEELIS